VKKIFGIINLIIIVMLLFSCSPKPTGTADMNTPENGGSEITASTDSDSVNTAEVSSNLEPKDMNGKKFTVLTQGWGYQPMDVTDIVADEITGEPINDAAYNRQIYLEDKYNITIEANDKGPDALKKAVKANDDVYDFCILRTVSFTSMVTNKYLVDLSDIPVINLSQPYWDSKSYDALSLLGKHYGINCDISKTWATTVWTVFFNKDMIKDNGLENPYKLVEEGKWTLDKMFEMGRVVAKDLNGDGKMDEKDLWGITYSDDSSVGMLNCMGVNFGEIDSNGYPVFTLDREDNIDKVMSLYTRLYDRSYCVNTHAPGLKLTNLGDVEMFIDGRTLFDLCGTYLIDLLRVMEQDCGILPYPKYDDTQKEYMSSVSPLFFTFTAVPVTNNDLENTGIIMEDMACEGYKKIKPEFYESLLLRKIARDDESAEMLGYIFDNIVYDSGGFLNLGGFSWDFAIKVPHNYDLNIVSFIEKYQGKIQKDIDAIVEALR